jgi:hypothetical protein
MILESLNQIINRFLTYSLVIFVCTQFLRANYARKHNLYAFYTLEVGCTSLCFDELAAWLNLDSTGHLQLCLLPAPMIRAVQSLIRVHSRRRSTFEVRNALLLLYKKSSAFSRRISMLSHDFGA